MASQAPLLLSWSLAALYGRGILQLGRSDAWFKSVYHLSGHDLQALPLERTLGLLTPPAAGGVVLQHWRAARCWALGASLWLTAWMPQRYDGLVALAFGLSLDRPEERTGPSAPPRDAGL